MKPGCYRLLDHTADMGIEIVGSDLCELFVNAARALFDLLVQGPRTGESQGWDLEIQGQDPADLMVNWLRELLFIWNGYQRLATCIAIKTISPTSLKADVETVVYNANQYEILREIKAVTYHRIAVQEQKSGWQARVYFDV